MNETLTIAVVIITITVVATLYLSFLAGVTILRLVRRRFYSEFMRRRRMGGRLM